VPAGGDEAKEPAIGGNPEIAKREIVQKGIGSRLRDGNVFAAGDHGEERNVEQNEVAGLFFKSALEHDAVSFGHPSIDAQTDTHASDAIGRAEVADFENFVVDIVGNKVAAGRNREALGVVIESGELLIVVEGEIEALETRRAIHVAVTLDSDTRVGAGNPCSGEEGAAFKDFSRTALRIAQRRHAEEDMWLDDFGKISDGGAVGEPSRVAGFEKNILAVGKLDDLAGVFDDQHDARVGGVGVVFSGQRQEDFGEDGVAVGPPMKCFNAVAEERVAVNELVAFEKTAATAARFLEPDVVALEDELFGFYDLRDGVNHVAVGSEGEGGDVFVDGLQRLLEINGLGKRSVSDKTKGSGAKKYSEELRPEAAAQRGTCHGLGCAAV